MHCIKVQNNKIFEAGEMTLEEYKEIKLQVLEDMCIHLTDEEMEHFDSLTSEIDVDHFARTLIMRG